jgi:hypothetical protein
MRWLPLALLLLASAATAAPTADLVASTTSCAAPCFVHFDAIGTTDSDTDVRPFHDLHYEIDYGDEACSSGQGAWANSNSGASKNSDTAPVGAHVYECAGTFGVDLRVTDSAGAVSTDSVTVTVTSEDSEWPTTETKCVSTSGTFTGCPSGATQSTSSDFDSALVLTAGARTLYRCGETFTIDTNPNVADAVANRSLVGGFGTCSGNPALVTYAGTATMLTDGDFDGWAIRDIRFTATGASTTAQFINNSLGALLTDFLLLRVSTLAVGVCAVIETPSTTTTWNERIAFVDYTCTMNFSVAESVWPVFFGSSRNSAFIGNSWTGDATESLFMRTMGLNKVLFAHNTMSAATGTNMTLQMRAPQTSANRADQYVVLQDNRFHDNAVTGENARTIVLCFGASCDGTNPAVEKADYIIEGNRVTYGALKPTVVQDFVQVSGRRVTVRNNIVDMRSVTGSSLNVELVSFNPLGTDPLPDHVDAYNNTIIRAGSTTGTTVACNFTGAAVGGRCRNNLIYDVDDTDNSLTSGAAYEAGNPSNNVHLNSGEEGCPFAGNDGSCTLSASGASMNFNEFKIRSSGGSRASVVDAGFDFPEATVGRQAYVYCDGFGGVRGLALGGSDAQWDIGAHEFGSSELCFSAAGLTSGAVLNGVVINGAVVQ